LLPSLANHFVYQSYFSYMLAPFVTSEPVLFSSLAVFLHLFGAGFYNFFLLVTMVLNLLVSYLLFKRYRFGLVYALIFTFSTYVWIHLGVHPALPQLWVIAFFVHLLFKFDDKGWTGKRVFLLTSVLFGSILISNYIGFFLLIFLSLHAVFTRGNLRHYLLIIFGSVIASAIILWPFVRIGYIAGSDYPTDSISQIGVARPYEDFFHFSSRPWYFAIPPVKNPWLGGLSKEILRRINDTNYFLADDYFAAEHQGNYFGLLLLTSTAIAFIYALLGGDEKLKKVSTKFGVMFVIIGSLMFPPFFTVRGITFFTPGQLMYKFFPMFRSTSRLGILLLLLALLLVAGAVDSMYKRFTTQRKLVSIFIALLLIVTLFETYIPLKFESVGQAPPVYEYMRDSLDKESKFMVFPYDRVDSALFWLGTHQQHLMNPKHLYIEGFTPAEFTENLKTSSGAEFANKLGVEYLLVFKDTLQVLEDTSKLEVLYEDSASILYKIL